MPIDFPSTPSVNQTYTSSGTTWIWTGSVWNVVTADTVINLPSQNLFSRIAVAGQSNIEADSATDTLTVIAGTNITITTDSNQDSITINSTASGGGGGVASNSFSTIAVSGQDNLVADSSTDTLTVVAGTGITVTTNASADSITITNSSANSTNTFADLNDVSPTDLTVDKIYLPAITMLNVTNTGASAYRFDQYGTANNPTISAINGTTIAFNLQAQGHPFLIQTAAGTAYNTGLIHVSTSGVVSTGAAAQGKDSGTLYWKIPTEISGGYRYQCSVHAPMVGGITIKNFLTL